MNTEQSPTATATARTPDTAHSATSATMRAVVQDRYGEVDELRLEQTDRPEIAADEVLVRVHAAGMDRGTWHTMTGRPYLMRIMGFGFRGPKNRVPGLDVAGTVVEVGSSVTRFAVGDEVFGISRGSFAEYAAAREDKLAAKPQSLTFEQAAVVPVSGITALQALRDAGRLQAGQRLLIIGASGGVGSYAIQIAKALGAHVTGVASTSKLDLLRSLGADDVIDYTREDFADGPDRYDLIIDIAGNSTLTRLRRVLTPHGTLVIVGGENGGPIMGGIGRQLRALAITPFLRHRLATHATKERASDLEPLTDLIETGQIIPSLEKTYTLDQVHAAMRHLQIGKVRGKVAVTPMLESRFTMPTAAKS
jgi:NADPH:quinone reductase-like Zn-dependent oxidoreductase